MFHRVILTTFLLSLSIPAHSDEGPRADQLSGLLDKFERVCVQTDLDAGSIGEFLKNGQAKRLSPDETVNLFAGIVPDERHGFELSDAHILRYSVQGQVTGENMRNSKSGILAISEPVDPATPLIDIFGDWDEDYIGVKDCSIVETNGTDSFGPMDIMERFSDLNIGWPIERFTIPVPFHGGTQIVDQYHWRFETGSISLLAGRDGSFNSLSYDRMIPLGVEPTTYSLDAVDESKN